MNRHKWEKTDESNWKCLKCGAKRTIIFTKFGDKIADYVTIPNGIQKPAVPMPTCDERLTK